MNATIPSATCSKCGKKTGSQSTKCSPCKAKREAEVEAEDRAAEMAEDFPFARISDFYRT